MTCPNKTYLSGSDVALAGMNAMNFIVPDIKACHFAALNDIHPKITCCFRIPPGYPVMFGNAATWLVSSTMNGVPHIRADIDDGYQLLHLFRSKPFTIDTV